MKDDIRKFLAEHPTYEPKDVIGLIREVCAEDDAALKAELKAELDAKRKALAEEYKAAGLPMRTRKAKGAA